MIIDEIARVVGYFCIGGFFGVALMMAWASVEDLARSVRSLHRRLTADRRARRDALARLVDIRTGKVRESHEPTPHEPPLGRAARRRKQ